MPPDPAPDYDAWQDYMTRLAGMYGDCAARHLQTVKAWPR